MHPLTVPRKGNGHNKSRPHSFGAWPSGSSLCASPGQVLSGAFLCLALQLFLLLLSGATMCTWPRPGGPTTLGIALPRRLQQSACAALCQPNQGCVPPGPFAAGQGLAGNYSCRRCGSGPTADTIEHVVELPPPLLYDTTAAAQAGVGANNRKGLSELRQLPSPLNGAPTPFEFAAAAGLQLRPLYGDPSLDPPHAPHLIALTVGARNMETVRRLLVPFNEATKEGGGPLFDLALFFYSSEGWTPSWAEDVWPGRGPILQIVAAKQTKWWFAKRFLHPDILGGPGPGRAGAYETLWLWDEDIGTEGFDPARYLAIAKSEDFLISQPALGNGTRGSWPITAQQLNSNSNQMPRPGDAVVFDSAIAGASPSGSRAGGALLVHRTAELGSTGCLVDAPREALLRPPCAKYVEVMVPVISISAWRCVWDLNQADLVHGWGVDMAWHRCAGEDPLEGMGVVDAEPVLHLAKPSLGGEGPSWRAVDDRR